MKYFHRTSVAPDTVLAQATTFFGARMSPAAEASRQRQFAGTLGQLTVRVTAEGGHYTLVEVETDQVGESELDKLAKRFLATVHALADSSYSLRGAY